MTTPTKITDLGQDIESVKAPLKLSRKGSVRTIAYPKLRKEVESSPYQLKNTVLRDAIVKCVKMQKRTGAEKVKKLTNKLTDEILSRR